MIDMTMSFRNPFIITLLLISSLLSACASPPPKVEKSYWQQAAEAQMQSGLQYYQRQQFRQALNQFADALASYQRYNDITGELNSRINLAKTSIALHQLDAAQAQIDTARELIERHGMADKRVYLDIMDSSIAIQNFSLKRAAGILDQYGDDASLPLQLQAALLTNKLRLAFAKQADAKPLLQAFESAVATQSAYQPRLWRFQAQQADIDKDFKRSDVLYGQALDTYRQQASSTGVMVTLREWGESMTLRGDWPAARIKFEDLYKTAKSVRLQYWVVESLESLVLVYRKLGDWDRVEWAKGEIEVLTRDN
jgi:tetratricopeptide (TPR) repeat protein